MIVLYSKDGITKKTEIHKFTYNGTFMGECFLMATIESEAPIVFEDGDFCIYRGETFVLSYDPAKEKQANRNTYGSAFVYNDIKFNSLADELTRVEFIDVVLPDNGVHYTSLPSFSFYASSVNDLADRIQANLDRVYKDGKRWTIEVSPDFVSSNKNISINNLNVSSALALVNTQFNANYIIRGRRITIGTAGLSVGKVFGYGRGNGLYDIQQTTNQDAAIITRLRAYASTRNMPYRYYNKMKDNNDEFIIDQSLYLPNLMLPSFPKIESNPSLIYLDSPYIAKYGIREGSVYFDTDDKEIYPSIEGMTASDLAEAGVTVSLPLGDNGIINECLGADNPIDDGKSPEEGEKGLEAQFFIFLKDLGFDLAEKDKDGQYIYAMTDTMQISMKSGMCVARTFDVVKNGITKDTSLGYTRYKIECNRFTDDSIDVAFPNSGYKIEAGDKVVILGISLPDVYIMAASQRLLAAAEKYLFENDKTKYTYTPKIDEIFMARNPQIGLSMKEGDIFDFSDTDLDIDASVIIQTLKIEEGNGSIPEYSITLSDDKIATSVEKIQADISTLMSNSTGVTIEQVKSIISSQGSQMFISRLKDDTVNGKITFNKEVYGSSFGNTTFTSGQFGSGFKMWTSDNGQSYAEIDNILVRRKMDVSKLTVDEIKSVGGQILVSLANMVVSNAEQLENSYKCSFDNADGKIPNLFAIDDQAICQTFTGNNTKYYWRKVVAVGADYIELSKTDKDGLNTPSIGDEIIQFGNRTDVNRQSAILISAYGSDSPSIKQYSGINSYDLTDKEKTVISPNGNKFTGSFTIETTGEDVKSLFEQQSDSISLLIKKTGIDNLGENDDLYSGIEITEDGVTAYGREFKVNSKLIAKQIDADGINIADGGFVVAKDESGGNKISIRGSLEIDWDGDYTKPVSKITAVDRSSSSEKTKIIITPQAIRSINDIIGNDTYPPVVVGGGVSSATISSGNQSYYFNNITLPLGRMHDLIIPPIYLEANWKSNEGLGLASFSMYLENTTTGETKLLITKSTDIGEEQVLYNNQIIINGLQAGVYRLRIKLSTRGSGTSAKYIIPANSKYTLRPIVEATEIGSNGMCSIFSTTNWFHATTDGFVVRMDKFGFKITADGIKKSNNMNLTSPTWTNM